MSVLAAEPPVLGVEPPVLEVEPLEVEPLEVEPAAHPPALVLGLPESLQMTPHSSQASSQPEWWEQGSQPGGGSVPLRGSVLPVRPRRLASLLPSRHSSS